MPLFVTQRGSERNPPDGNCILIHPARLLEQTRKGPVEPGHFILDAIAA
jgi:hypothetical protein